MNTYVDCDCSFQKMLLKQCQECIFVKRFQLQKFQQHTLCMGQNKLVCVFMVMTEDVTRCNTTVFEEQWNSMRRGGR